MQEETLDIAIIGMAGRFPGAKDLITFWDNLCGGVESITFFTDEELTVAGIDPAVFSAPNYVRASPILDDVEFFDASFFGYAPREAQTMDPQQRLFLECAWQALEQAGYDSERFGGAIGVFAGAAMNTYLLFSGLLPRFATDYFPTLINSDKDFLPTRVSYKLNLTGPSVAVQTACSTSLVAVHMACQSLLNHECDMALAGGVSVRVPHKTGYVYQEESLFSPDGHCRTFDAQAQGTLFGSGVGVVIVKRLADALADGDHIHAIIKGSAINNDGALKAGYTAPSVTGQAEVVAEALANADVEPETISYVEAHGTGTALGDPVEMSALAKAFGDQLPRKGFCAIGSVKTNIGHLDAAAGVAGLIKTVLALTHKCLPPSLHFDTPNPAIDFANSPFYVNTKLTEWRTGRASRRAGVNSLGVGGTNAHVVLEEALCVEPSVPSRPWQLLLLSAKTDTALDQTTMNLTQHLQQQPAPNLADVTYTLQVGRRRFNHRRMLVCRDLDDAVTTLEMQDPKRILTAVQKPTNRPIVFMFPGGGAQYVNMGVDLYHTEPAFREQIDLGAELLTPQLGFDVRTVLYPGDDQTVEVAQQLEQPSFALPALFLTEYALAKLWMSWGIRPQAMIGHSLGEYAAACLAGVVSLEDALALVVLRGRLFETLPTGAMLSVPLPEAEVRSRLPQELSIAAINTPSMCVVAGPIAIVEAMEQELAADGLEARRLHIAVAAHSAMLEPILEEFRALVEQLHLHPPRIPYISNVTGAWITPAETTDANYWVRHLRHSVRFADGIHELLQEPQRILLEVGPGQTLSSFARQHPDNQVVLSSLRHPHDRQSDVAFMLQALGRMWLVGTDINWEGFYARERRHRIPLPTYPFERQHYWLEPQSQSGMSQTLHKRRHMADWFYVPSWKRTPLRHVLKDTPAQQKACWLLLSDAYGVGAGMAQQLEQAGQDVTIVTIGHAFTRLRDGVYTLDPRQSADYDALLTALVSQGKTPNTIVHLWSLTSHQQTQLTTEELLDRGFYSLLFLVQALGNQNATEPLHIGVVSNGAQEVTGDETLCPEKAAVLGPCKVIPREYANITCSSIDIMLSASGASPEQVLIHHLIAEFAALPSDVFVAYRGRHRWVQAFEPLHLDATATESTRLRNCGVYLITGGFGGIGLVLAEYLAQTVQARLILVGRSAVPARQDWSQWLASHDEQEEVSRKIRKVQALETLGAEVLVARADVTNEVHMQAVIDQAHERFGTIDGVIHAAGIEQDGLLQLKDPEVAAAVLAPKVKGTRVLQTLLQNTRLDFLVLFSSINAILGPLGQVDYSAANTFFDAFAHWQNSQHGPWTVSINWSAWQGVGMAIKVPVGPEKWHQERLNYEVLPQEGLEVFRRILGTTLPQVIVSTQPLQAAMAHQDAFSISSYLDDYEQGATSRAIPARSVLSTAYVAPRNEVERTVAETLQHVLGIEQVGIHDNFMELGGNSLLAFQIISRLRDTFQMALTVRTLFDYPTVTELAMHIQKVRDASREDAEKIAHIFEKVEQLSVEDAKKLLAE